MVVIFVALFLKSSSIKPALKSLGSYCSSSASVVLFPTLMGYTRATFMSLIMRWPLSGDSSRHGLRFLARWKIKLTFVVFKGIWESRKEMTFGLFDQVWGWLGNKSYDCYEPFPRRRPVGGHCVIFCTRTKDTGSFHKRNPCVVCNLQWKLQELFLTSS